MNSNDTSSDVTAKSSETNEQSLHTNPLVSFNSTSEQVFSLYEIPAELVVLLTILYLLVSFCAIVGNSMVLWIVMKSKAMRSVTNLFISNIAISDISLGALSIPFQFQAALLQKWLLPDALCALCPTVQIISLNVSTFTLVALSYDRHRAITSPLAPRMARSCAFKINSCIWLISILLSLPTFAAYNIEWHETSDNVTEASCRMNGLPSSFLQPYNHTLVVFQYIVPFCAITFFYTHMAIVLTKNIKLSDGTLQIHSSRSIKSKKRVIKMLLIVNAIFAFCWLPFQLYNILQDIFPHIN